MADEKIPGAEKKIVAGILGIVLGGFGVHRFYLGDTTGGILRIVITFLTCGIGGWLGIIEGIMYLIKSDEDFVKEYIEGDKKWL
jgi:TM2 domain-containing membrane protein YozV